MARSILLIGSTFLLVGCMASKSMYAPQVESKYLVSHGSACSGSSYTFTQKLNPNVSFEADVLNRWGRYTISARFRLASKHSVQFLDDQITFHDLDNGNATQLKIMGAYSGAKDQNYATMFGLPEVRLNPLSPMIGEYRESKIPMVWGEWSDWRDKERDVINIEIAQFSTELPSEFEVALPLLKVDGEITKVESIRFKWINETFVQCIQ